MLNERSKGLLAKLPKERLDKYVEVRDYLLREFKLTAGQYRERFRTAVKSLTETYTLFGSRVKNLFLYYLQNRQAKTAEQVIDLLVSDRIKETLSPACLRHVLSTEGTGWFAPEKLAEVIDTYENSQMYLPGKYSKFSGTGSAKPRDKFVKPGGCFLPSQNVGNSQNSAAYPCWKTGRSSQANGTPSRCWLCNEVGHRAVQCKKRIATQVGSSQEKRGASGRANGVNNVKAEPVQCNRVVIEARNQPGTNLIGARPAQDIPMISVPDSSVYRVADQVCEEIARKHGNNADETNVKSVVSALHDHNAGHIATDEPETRLVNKVDFLMKGFRVRTHFLTRWIWQIVNYLCSCQNCNIAMF